MTIVTTSRKPSPEVRKLAKEISFALDLPYIHRGKAGLRDFEQKDSKIIIISGSKRGGQIFDIELNGELVFSMLITNIIETDRKGLIKKGFFTREKDLYNYLSPYVSITFDESAEGPICFCAAQKKYYVLQGDV
ncbi:MAG TPA: hypothetical protein O0W90_02050 [Methanocorpusculum sp.]|nr:hypothetical protein [Methanocorpusculum sp.]